MTMRGVFIPKDTYPYFEEVYVSFDWFGGFAKVQKQRCALSLMLNFNEAYWNKGYKLLEISSGSLEPLGEKLSAMSLKKYVPSEGKSYYLESVFQSSRIYNNSGILIGPHHEFYSMEGKACKKKVKELSLGLISYKYEFEGVIFPAPAFHISLFYDYLYLNALLEPENRAVRDELLKSGYNAFSDLATKALNSQARSCALFVALYNNCLIDKVKDIKSFLDLFRVNMNNPNYAYENSYENVQLLVRNTSYVKPLRDLAPMVYTKLEVQTFYDSLKYRNDNINKVVMNTKFKKVKGLILSNSIVGVRLISDGIPHDIPYDISVDNFRYCGIDVSKLRDMINVIYYNGEYVTEWELNHSKVEEICGDINVFNYIRRIIDTLY